MNNEIAPVLDMLEELKQDCKAISKAQVELRTTIAEQLSTPNPKGDSAKTQETVQMHLSKETQTKIKEHQLFVLEALSESNKKLDPKFEALHQLISKQQNEPMVHSVDESYFITDLSEAISEVFSMPTPSNGVDVDELRFQKKLRNRANRKRRI